jgi:hypothetical protein
VNAYQKEKKAVSHMRHLRLWHYKENTTGTAMQKHRLPKETVT